MEKNKNEMKMSPSDPFFDNYSSFQKRFKILICPRVKNKVYLPLFL